ncbi:hypothetical protein AVEN_34076-1 [Araneus ventricosus]|uniref:Uncharacterized protein n=1 Tax=Araneus ventricosus TaxID=182803 RepID=A0A4Y2P6C1_ARAVE|nr:hypothetical protein AVEN_34076-1 [Araneus ventricosus]
MSWIVQSIAVVLVLATLQCGAQRAREVLRGQVAMLRREQWRDRERIEALERRLLARGERDSPSSQEVASEGIFEVLEEVTREISGLAEELRQRQWLEEAVASLQAKQEEDGRVLRQLSRRVEVLEEEQRNISQLVSGKGKSLVFLLYFVCFGFEFNRLAAHEQGPLFIPF